MVAVAISRFFDALDKNLKGPLFGSGERWAAFARLRPYIYQSLTADYGEEATAW